MVHKHSTMIVEIPVEAAYMPWVTRMYGNPWKYSAKEGIGEIIRMASVRRKHPSSTAKLSSPQGWQVELCNLQWARSNGLQALLPDGDQDYLIKSVNIYLVQEIKKCCAIYCAAACAENVSRRLATLRFLKMYGLGKASRMNYDVMNKHFTRTRAKQNVLEVISCQAAEELEETNKVKYLYSVSLGNMVVRRKGRKISPNKQGRQRVLATKKKTLKEQNLTKK